MAKPKIFSRLLIEEAPDKDCENYSPEHGDCSDMGFNCCNCGGEGCGCSYCWSCQACEHCKNKD